MRIFATLALAATYAGTTAAQAGSGCNGTEQHLIGRDMVCGFNVLNDCDGYDLTIHGEPFFRSSYGYDAYTKLWHGTIVRKDGENVPGESVAIKQVVRTYNHHENILAGSAIQQKLAAMNGDEDKASTSGAVIPRVRGWCAKGDYEYNLQAYVPAHNLGVLSLRPNKEKHSVFSQILETFEEVHGYDDKSFAHGDVQPSNFLAWKRENEDIRAAIVDFDMATPGQKAPRRKADTVWQPIGLFPLSQLLRHHTDLVTEMSEGHYDPQLADVYGLGCTLLTKITGSAPDWEAPTSDKARFIVDAKDANELSDELLNRTPGLRPRAARLIAKALVRESKGRIDVKTFRKEFAALPPMALGMKKSG